MLYVGTSGWQYRHWRDAFYPKGVAQRDWLAWYARHFRTVELNNSFYRLPEASSFERWRDGTPRGFRFAVKMSRYLTHIRRLREPAEPVARFMDRASRLGPKLGPVLVQLPPHMPADPERLDVALAQFPPRTRVAVEFRDPSWFCEEVRQVLRRRSAALCLADAPDFQTPRWRTTPWGFVRFHAGHGTPFPCYQEGELDRWAHRIAELWPASSSVYAYFNNDTNCCAPRDAVTFARLAERAGLNPSSVSRSPSPQGS